jgi:hypothetical protein
MEELGISPFMRIFRGISPVGGAILGKNLDLYKELVENSSLESKNSKYSVINSRHERIYNETRVASDNFDNNIFHYIFSINGKKEDCG